MTKNLDLATQLFKKGTVLLIPAVKFPGGVTKAKFAVLLEDAKALFKRGRVIACFTTSRKFERVKSWFVIAPATILGKSSKNTTTIDCLNRISLSEEQIKKCRFIGYLPDGIWDEVEEANSFAEFYLSRMRPDKAE